MKITKIADTLKKENKEEKAIEETLSKAEEVKTEEVETKVEEEVKTEEVKTETPVEEVKTEEPVKEEPVETPVEEEPAKTETEEPVVETVEEKVDEPQAVKVDAAELKEVLADFAKQMKHLSHSIKKAVKTIKAPAEAVAVTEEPKVEVEKVETPKEEKVEKTDTPSGEASNQAILDSLNDIKKRLQTLEDSPGPSKVIISKNFLAEGVEDTKTELEKVESRLSELNKIRQANPSEFTEALQTEAFSLINKREVLKA